MSSQDYTSRYLFSEAQAQTQYSSEDIAVRNLFNDRNLYDNYPDFQRGYVWPDKFKRALIDSILRGFPIHPLLAYKETNSDGEEQYYIVDGRQRLSTIYDFLTGKIATSSSARGREEERILPTVEPHRHFQELTDRARNTFLSYKFTVNLVDGTKKAEVSALFRRIQHQLGLRASERLATYTSAAKDLAFRLQDNPIWRLFYMGDDSHKQIFQACLMVIELEMMQGRTSLKSTHLNVLASGAQDKYITESLYAAIESRLEVVMHVFAGSAFTMRAAIIPMYQSVIFLESQGHVFTSSHKGCLSQWFGRILYEADMTGIRGFTHPIATLQNVNRQQEFWQVHLPILTEICKGERENVA